MGRQKSHGTFVAEEMNRDPEFRDEWERTPLARLVAAQLIKYRSVNKLSQRELDPACEREPERGRDGEDRRRDPPHPARAERVGEDPGRDHARA